MDGQTSEGRDRSISRRVVLKRIGAVSAVAWTTPILMSFRTPVFAQGSPPPGNCSPCEGDFCTGQTPCAAVCFCRQSAPEGGSSVGPCMCSCGGSCGTCDTFPQCPIGQSQCPPRYICTHSCCDELGYPPL